VLQAYRSRVTFFNLANSFHLLQQGTTVCPPPLDVFLRLAVSAVEDHKFTHQGE